MKAHTGVRRWQVRFLLTLAAAVLLLIVLTFWIADLRHKLAQIQKQSQFCQLYLPVRFLVEEPDCANKLIKFLGISNVQISTALMKNSSG